MSAEHQSDGEDAEDSQDRPDNTGSVSDKDGGPDIDGSDEENDNARRVSPSQPGSSEDQPEPNAGSPGADKLKARCSAAAAPQGGSGGSRGGSLFSWLRSRTIRRGLFVDPARDNFRTMTSLYCSMNPAVESVNLSTQTHGAVFNLEYSPDG